jgi:hypothetical protein
MMTRTLSHRRIHRHAHPIETPSHKRKASSFKFQIVSRAVEKSKGKTHTREFSSRQSRYVLKKFGILNCHRCS